MKPDRSKLPALIILTQREHQRLNNQIKRLQTYALDVEEIEEIGVKEIGEIGVRVKINI